MPLFTVTVAVKCYDIYQVEAESWKQATQQMEDSLSQSVLGSHPSGYHGVTKGIPPIRTDHDGDAEAEVAFIDRLDGEAVDDVRESFIERSSARRIAGGRSHADHRLQDDPASALRNLNSTGPSSNVSVIPALGSSKPGDATTLSKTGRLHRCSSALQT